MDAKLERLSSSVLDKVQEAQELRQRGDEIEQQIDNFRQRASSPLKLSQRKLYLATIQSEFIADSESHQQQQALTSSYRLYRRPRSRTGRTSDNAYRMPQDRRTNVSDS